MKLIFYTEEYNSEIDVFVLLVSNNGTIIRDYENFSQHFQRIQNFFEHIKQFRENLFWRLKIENIGSNTILYRAIQKGAKVSH